MFFDIKKYFFIFCIIVNLLFAESNGVNLKQLNNKVQLMKKEIIINKNIFNNKYFKTVEKINNKKRNLINNVILKTNISNIQKEKNCNKFFKNNRIYIFLSKSVPLEIWKEYAFYLHKNKIYNGSLVLRGCIKNCTYLKPTINFISKVLKTENKKLNINIQIDPLIYRKFNILKVPCVVYASNVKIKNYNLSIGLKNNVNIEKYYKSCGDWSMKYHLENLYKKSLNKDLLYLIKKINNEK